MIKKVVAFFALVLFLVLLPAVAGAQFFNEVKLQAYGPQAGGGVDGLLIGGSFSYSLDISGDTAVVGRPGSFDSAYPSFSGAAYIYVRNPVSGAWSQIQRLESPLIRDQIFFGSSVSISGNTMIVGAYGETGNVISTGAAYIYVRANSGLWVLQQKLQADDGVRDDWFGGAVSVSGDVAVVGAYRVTAGGLERSGAAYVFERDASGVWMQQSKLLPADTASRDWFGWAVAVDGAELIVGALGRDAGGGAAFVFKKDATGAWVQQKKLLASDGLSGDRFGESVAISNGRVAIGAKAEWTDPLQRYAGSVYLYTRNASDIWGAEVKLRASDASKDDYFGSSVALDGDTLLVGAFRDGAGGADAGSAYLFTHSATSGWTQQLKQVGQETARFGESVALDAGFLLVGARWAGLAYVYTLSAGAQPDITITDSLAPSADLQLPFGDVTELSSAEQTVTITNDGTADLVLGSIADSDLLALPFSLSADSCSLQTLTPSASCSLTLRFSPASIGAFSDSFDIPSNDGDENLVTVSVSGNGVGVPAADISVIDAISPADDLRVDFGGVAEQASAGQVVTVKNVGNADLSIGSIGVADALAAPFSISSDTCSDQTLVALASCHFRVQFAPTAVGGFSDTFDIPSDDADENPVTVSLDGTGTARPVPDITVTDSVSPNADLQIPFGNVTASTAALQTVTVSNDGTAGLLLGTVGTANPLAAPFSVTGDNCSSQTLLPSANCTLSVRFAPTAAGTFNDSFDIPSNDADEASVTVSLSGVGVVSVAPDIAVSDAVAPVDDLQVPFGSVVSAATASQDVTVLNAGNADLQIGAIASANTLNPPFSVSADSCSNQTLVPAATCTLTLQFAPTAVGSFSDSLDIPSSDADEASVMVSVSGTGTPLPVADISVTDSVGLANDRQMAFATLAVGSTSVQTVTISNSGDAGLVIGTLAQNDALAAPFTLANDNCSGQTLAAAASCSVEVRFSPAVVGSSNDSFDIPSNDPDTTSVTVNVSGSGVVSVNSAPSAPLLVSPANGEEDLGSRVTLRWSKSSDPDGDAVSYEVYNCTDRSPLRNCGRVAKLALMGGSLAPPTGQGGSGLLLAGLGLGGGVALLGFTLAGGVRSRKQMALLLMAIAVAALLTACSGDSSLRTYTVTDLAPNTTYYWTVVATDGKGGEAASAVWHYTTGQ